MEPSSIKRIFGLSATADHASVSDFSSLGDHIDSTAGSGIYHIVWTDNRYGRDPFSPREHLFADRH
jgi:hypothetical protein